MSEAVSPPIEHPGEAAATAQLDEHQLPGDSNTAPPSFEPLFTLLTNETTNTTVHPRVQYLFADDDTSVLSNPPDRAVIVDLAPSADNTHWAVSWASSLSADFAVTGSRLAAQQADGEASDSGAAMLRIEGVEREPVDDVRGDSLPASGSGSAAMGSDDVEALAVEFRRRMGVLKKVVGEGERRKQLQQQQLQSPHEELADPSKSQDEVRRGGVDDSEGARESD
ncbi:hypothetical protein TOPH_04104 [Tolypocladium ophioglossoides CBS 100239]|uniref:Uncharacterized protein n=1 Tax=Tolypocladium ophioglossoides (strain CBS 100239) TaxID=1163406 RepID=A0A0L0NB28_TOLOC|nr:hypothetical protein TOPH_04104 [Tolypocladium ophioglossoides CBS 100239]